MKTIDARGLSCPEPVLLTKKTLDSGERSFVVLVDSEAPKENIKRFCAKQGCDLQANLEDGVWELTVRLP